MNELSIPETVTVSAVPFESIQDGQDGSHGSDSSEGQEDELKAEDTGAMNYWEYRKWCYYRNGLAIPSMDKEEESSEDEDSNDDSDNNVDQVQMRRKSEVAHVEDC